jgi:hypothetical protein
MEAEFIALDTIIIESEWLHELLMDLLVVEKHVLGIILNYDNQTCIHCLRFFFISCGYVGNLNC